MPQQPTLTRAIAALRARIGFDVSRCRATARGLQKAGVLPVGGNGASPQITLDQFLSLLVAAAIDAPPRSVAQDVARYMALMPAGVPETVVPDSVKKKIGFMPSGEYLRGAAWLALGNILDQKLVSGQRIEFVVSWPEMAIHHAGGLVDRYVDPGALATHWQSSFRRSAAIEGSAFIDAVRDLFLIGDEHAH